MHLEGPNRGGLSCESCSVNRPSSMENFFCWWRDLAHPRLRFKFNQGVGHCSQYTSLCTWLQEVCQHIICALPENWVKRCFQQCVRIKRVDTKQLARPDTSRAEITSSSSTSKIVKVAHDTQEQLVDPPPRRNHQPLP